MEVSETSQKIEIKLMNLADIRYDRYTIGSKGNFAIGPIALSDVRCTMISLTLEPNGLLFVPFRRKSHLYELVVNY